MHPQKISWPHVFFFLYSIIFEVIFFVTSLIDKSFFITSTNVNKYIYIYKKFKSSGENPLPWHPCSHFLGCLIETSHTHTHTRTRTRTRPHTCVLCIYVCIGINIWCMLVYIPNFSSGSITCTFFLVIGSWCTYLDGFGWFRLCVSQYRYYSGMFQVFNFNFICFRLIYFHGLQMIAGPTQLGIQRSI